ncbi:P83/100 family protein [Treponema sp.]|uniref:P83/100 family protein n=1 Tax=Treponema sp. TaxID=166 RepID=UPI00298E1EEB|nr:P83/100 family protein [Treponema sp.]MCR5613921.1 hypothetical protein [Treponema sp.]
MKSYSAAKKILGATIFFFTASLFVFAEGVNESEIRSVSNQTIVFENYTGPHTKVDTLDQIKEIGTSLASGIDKTKSGTAGSSNRYYVIHSVTSDGTDLLDADIFIIGKDSSVDHIRNLRHIIASYLSSAYGYKYDDAYTIATFVTVYNAVYRGNVDYFSKKYKKAVVNNLTSDKAGLAISYKEWAGASQIVIPLSDIDGGLSTIDTSVISDKKVVESMQEEDDKGIDQRKNMVDIKEREADSSQSKAQDAQKKATKEETQLKEEKKDLKEKQEEADQKTKTAEESQKKADEAKKKAEENPGDKKLQEEAKQAQKKADEDKKAAAESTSKVEEQQKKVEEQQKKVDESKKTAQKEQEKADKKQSEAQSERTQIAKDQKEVIAKEIAEETNAVYALKLVDEKNLYSAIVKVNRETNEELKTSPVKVIRNRTAYRDGSNFIAIAGQTGNTAAVKLVQIDKDSLEIVGESEEQIAENSVLIQNGSEYCCVINDKGKYYVGKFNSKLECTVKSPVEVNPATPIFVGPEGFFVTTKANKAVLLKASDLTAVGK